MFKQNNISEELKLISPAVANLPNTTPFSVPPGYFKALTPKILQRIGLDAVEEHEMDPSLSPLLQSLKNENPFQIPKDYFKQFKTGVELEEIKPIVQVFTWKKWIRYAAAASVVGIIGMTVYFNTDSSNVSLAVIPKTELETQPLSTESMQSYLNDVDQLQQVELTSPDLSSENNLLVELTPTLISEILKEIPENDISSFMAQSGGNETLALN